MTMSRGGDETWVTFVKNEDDLLNAFILAKSIRRTFSHRKILAMHPSKITSKTRDLLLATFDGVVYVPQLFDWINQDSVAFAKIFCLSLPCISKCVFLDSNTLVLNNCDRLFSVSGLGIANKTNNNGMDTSLMVLTPSLKAFNEFVETLEENHLKDASFDAGVALINFVQRFEGYKTLAAEFSIMFQNTGKLKNGYKNLNYLCDHDARNKNFSKDNISAYYDDLNKECQNAISHNLCSPMISKIPSDQKGMLEPIAIVGLSLRFPGANNKEEYWNLMMNQEDTMRPVPINRWTQEQSCFVDEIDRQQHAGWINWDVESCDGKFFGISPAEMQYVDPQQRLLMEVTWEALEDAAINPASLKGTNTGIYTGQWKYDYRELMIQSGYTETEFFRAYMGNAFGTTASRPAHFLGTTGPNIASESGCSSSMVSVGLATAALRAGETDLALTAGVNLLLHPYCFKDIKHIISEDGRSKPFDESADGFARAEGCGVLVLKRLSDAVRDNDRIYSLIRGYGMSQEGLSKSMGTPTVECEATAMRRALANANVSPAEVTFVEAHGTGTPVGDPLEVQAISEVYSANRTTNLVIGSVKSNIGHTESCSGIAGIIKTILSFEKETIPPHRMLNKLNPKINLEAIPAIIPLEPQPWKRVPGVPRIAGVSSFGITGTDAHIILQEPPENNNKDYKKNSVNDGTVFTVSARSEKALEDSLINYQNYLNETIQDLNDIAFTASTGRMHFNHRVAVVGKNCKEISEKIEKQIFEKNIAAEKKSKVCFLFTGQGSQYFGMGKSLYQYSPIFRNCFDECDKVLQDLFQINIKAACWGDNKKLIHDSLYSQTCIFVYEYCMVKMLENWGIVPDAVLGHSLGEFCAAVTAGFLDVKDALQLVGTRSTLINSLPTGAMVVVKADLRSTKHLMSLFPKQNALWLDLAAINSAEQTTLAGPLETVKLFADFAKYNNDVKTHILNATHAFHSRDMDPILDRYRQTAASMKFRAPTCEFISGVEGTAINKITPEYWINHTRNPVNFVSASEETHKLGLETFIEVGPQPVLLALLSSNMQGQQSNNFYCSMGTRHLEETSALLKAVSQLYVKGLPIDWEKFHQHNSPRKVDLPFYPFQREKCWFKQEMHCEWRKQIYQTGSKTAHALIGTELLVPTKDRVFQSFLTLQSIPWVTGHKIAEHVILPGAAYVEMAVTAGYSALHEPHLSLDTPLFPVVVENLQILQPLEMFDDKTLEIQTVVSTKTNEDKTTTTISTFSRKRGLKQENSTNWVKHTEGKFSYGDVLNNKIQKPDFLSIRNGMKELQNEDVYPRLTKLGYNFSNEFQSIRKVFKSDSEAFFEVNVPLEGDEPTNYFCHPVTIDAMLQAILVGTSDEKNDIYLPVIVKKFVFFKRGESQTKFVHVFKNSETSETVVVLYDKNGDSLALVEGLDFVKTTIDKLTKALRSSMESCLPSFVETWKSSKWTRSMLRNDENADFSLITSSILQVVSTLQEDAERIKLDAVITQRVIKTFCNLGFDTKTVGEEIEIVSLMKKINVAVKSERMIIRLMQFLAEDGYLEESRNDSTKFTVKKLFPSNTNLKELNTDFQILKVEWACASLFLDNLKDILTEKTSALSLLFPNTDAPVTAETYYRDILSSRQAGGIMEQAVENVIKARALCNSDFNVPLRILEIGGGTASATLSVLNVLNKYETNCIYDFTDISSAFFENGKNILRAKNTTFQFKMLNIEGDPKMQGFVPHEYDLVIASNVLHATQDLYETTANVRHLTKDQGILIIYETFIPARFVDLAFCHLDGYWRFSGNDGRSRHCVINESCWKNVLQKTNFPDSVTFGLYGGNGGVIVAKASKDILFNYKLPKSLNPKIWIVFDNECSISKFLIDSLKRSDCIVVSLTKGTSFEAKKTSFVIRPECREDVKQTFENVKNNFNNTQVEGVIYLWGLDSNMISQSLVKSYLHLEQTLLEIDLPKQPKHYLITRGQIYFENDVPTLPSSSLLLGMCRSFRTENATMFARSIDLDPNDDCSLDHAYQIFSELWISDGHPLIAYRNKTRNIAQLETSTLSNTFKPLKLPRSEYYALTLPSTKSFADLKFGLVPKQSPTGHQILVQIKAAGLNFRDIFSVLKPTEQFENANAIGADFSGTIISIGSMVENWKIGDHVLGCNFQANALPSHTILEESQVISLPNYMTFAEGATLPCVYATVYHSLIDVGKLKSGETILIHTASGGVGLVAIQVAKYLGAKVIATAGSSRKRNYLKSLGLEQVYNSRDLTFAKFIKESGMPLVDMVLNSLTGPGFKEASLSCCKNNARFVEMSKLNVWSSEEVKEFRPDVKYYIVDITQESSDEWSRLMKKLQQDLVLKKVKPLPNDQFLARDIRNALKHLEKAKQIGKVVLIMPEGAEYQNQMEDKPQLFNSRSTYLITGGLTGIGLEVAKWMSKAGARNLIICGRRPPVPSTAESLEKLRETGCNVVVKKVDVGSIEECRTLFDFIKIDMSPLKGVMHCAGCLSDATILNQTWEKFEITMNPKVNGGWNLHELTKELNLEHFVLFSSFTSIMGSPGQSNHVASNTYLDTLAHYRHAQGLSATSINWGQWGEIGVAADIKVLGFVPFSISKGIRSLQDILLSKLVQVSVLEGEFNTWKIYFPWAKTYMESIQDVSSSKTKRNKLKSSEEFWKEMDECLNTNLKKNVVEVYLCSILSLILKTDENIEKNQEFQEFGMDSLMMIEFKNHVQGMLGSKITLSPTDLADSNTVNLLSNKIMDTLKDVES